MPVPCPPRRVRFIDDDPGVLKTLAYLLRKVGHDVEEAENGSAGLARFREKPVDIILTDFRMPGCTGGEVARAVKAINPRAPVVYVTGYAHEIPPHERALAEAIVEKPCGLTALQTVIRALTGHAGDRPTAGPALASA
jgi:CheY-like chemotaxis protein